METWKFRWLGRSQRSVSNPLGWDGDAVEFQSSPTVGVVSNPLGWDGDILAEYEQTATGEVSNPLGWDGDRDNVASADN